MELRCHYLSSYMLPDMSFCLTICSWLSRILIKQQSSRSPLLNLINKNELCTMKKTWDTEKKKLQTKSFQKVKTCRLLYKGPGSSSAMSQWSIWRNNVLLHFYVWTIAINSEPTLFYFASPAFLEVAVFFHSWINRKVQSVFVSFMQLQILAPISKVTAILSLHTCTFVSTG